MKKQILFLILVLGIALNINAQGPIKPYNENGYTLSEVETFALSGSALANSWRDNMLSIINDGMVAADINMILDQRHISWIIDHIHYEVVTLTNFTNSRKTNGGSIEFFTDHNTFTGQVGVFEYEGLKIILFKTICLNLLDIQPQVITKQESPISPLATPVQSQLPVVPVAQEDAPTLPKNVGELRAAILSTPTSVQQPVIPSVKRNWKPVIVVAGVTLTTATLGYLAYTLLKSKPTAPGGSPVDPTGGDVGGPVDPTGGSVGP